MPKTAGRPASPEGKLKTRMKNAKKRDSKKANKAARKKTAEAEQFEEESTSTTPAITEDDLLNFQLSHFGDATEPDTWFVDAEAALEYDPRYEEEEDDELGWYEDGVKRTLTDEQIEMFRHSEMESLAREARLKRENEGQSEDADEEEYAPPEIFATAADEKVAPASPASNASSMDNDLLGLAHPSLEPPPREVPRQQSWDRRSGTPLSAAARRGSRKEEIPYDQRHKRTWEQYIEGEDADEGSLTHRRLVRELDDHHETSVELEY